MKRDIFLLLGGNKLNYGIVKKFKDKNFLVYVVDWNKEPQIKGDRHFQIDVKDPSTIINKLKNENLLESIKFAYTSIDLAVGSVAQINNAINLKTISQNALKYASSKSMQSFAWNKAGLLNKISKKYSEFDSGITDLNNKYNIIIKPDNSASSRGITIVKRNSSLEFLKESFNKALNESSNNSVVVEEFLEGIEFTVEMIGDSWENVGVFAISKKTHTKNTDNNKIAVKLHYNCSDDELQAKIADFAIKCYKALGFSSSLGHFEVILKPDGTLAPVEIGARSSGFIASDLVDIVCGKNYIEELLKVQNGSKIANGLLKQTNKCSMYFFYDFPENKKIKQVCNLCDFLDSNIKSLYHDRTNIKFGNFFQKINSDNARYGYEILTGDKKIMTEKYISDREKEMLKVMFGD